MENGPQWKFTENPLINCNNPRLLNIFQYIGVEGTPKFIAISFHVLFWREFQYLLTEQQTSRSGARQVKWTGHHFPSETTRVVHSSSQTDSSSYPSLNNSVGVQQEQRTAPKDDVRLLSRSWHDQTTWHARRAGWIEGSGSNEEMSIQTLSSSLNRPFSLKSHTNRVGWFASLLISGLSGRGSLNIVIYTHRTDGWTSDQGQIRPDIRCDWILWCGQKKSRFT